MTIINARSRSWILPAVLSLLPVVPAAAGQQTFATPEQAIEALTEVISAEDAATTERLFGEGSVALFDSGDREMDLQDYRRVKAMIAEKVEFADHDDTTKVALFGANGWPWPIPLVLEEGRWRFDTAAGWEELLNRRIGRNELHTLVVLREIVNAQREYALVGRDGRPPAYAQKFRSSPGRQDGLYWSTAEGEPLSPLGGLVAESDMAGSEPRPFHGYFFRILTAQGPSAPGGERSYIDAEGNMPSGFAVLAWPARYGASGVMTFLMSQRGIIYEQDLGEDTPEIATSIDAFDPGPSWSPTGDAGRLVVE